MAPSLEVGLFVGDLLQVGADAICTSTNPWLSLQAGSGGSVRMAAGHVLQDLCDGIVAEERARSGRRFLQLGSAHATVPESLGFRMVIHCVAIDAFHGSSRETIAACVKNALAVAASNDLEELAMPVFATGHGRFSFEEAVKAMISALEERSTGSVQRVWIVVPDIDRGETALKYLRAAFGFVPVNVFSGWWVGLYAGVLHGNYLRSGVNEFAAFIAESHRVLTEVDAPGVRRLLWASNWRSRIVAAWLAGLKGYSHMTPTIGDLLVESELTYAGQGYCFALARFASAASARQLCRYLDKWLSDGAGPGDQDWALAALEQVDARRGTALAAPYLAPGGKWERFGASSGMTLGPAREVLRDMMASARNSFAAHPAEH